MCSYHGHELGQTLGDDERQEALACCSHGVTKSWTQLSHRTTASSHILLIGYG